MMQQSPFFLPYQQKWIQDNSRLKIMEKARQIGISWATAYGIIRSTAQENQPYDTWICSRDELQAKLFIQDCSQFANTINLAATEISEPILRKQAKTPTTVLEFCNKKRVYSLSSNPNAQAGKRGSRVLDEFALHPDPYELYSISYPGISWGGQLAIISTHRESKNFFNSLIQEIRENGNPKNFSLHRVTLQDALDQGFLKKLKAKLPLDDPRQSMTEGDYYDFIRKSSPDEESFLQEYMCQPSDTQTIFLNYALIEPCLYESSFEWENQLQQEGHYPLYLGVDVARKEDLTVFWLLESVHSILFTRKIVCLKNSSFSEQESILWDFLQYKNLRFVCIDQTGIGYQFTEKAIERFGTSKIEGIYFTQTIKSVLAYELRARFEKQSIRIPNSPEILSDLRSIKKECTPTGTIRFSADRSKNGHADRFWALALAVNASLKMPQESKYESIKLSNHSGFSSRPNHIHKN
jgi:phage FluMu gp28-like protein